MVRRTVLFSPGDQPELMAKAPESGADVVVFDLEDAVAPGEKGRAREAVSSTLPDLDPDCEVCVRVNPLAEGGRTDVETVLADTDTVDSVMLPKVAGAADVAALSEELHSHGADLPALALLETAGGVLHAEAIASADATDAVLLGAEDLAADIGATRTEAGTEVSHARQRVVLAAGYGDVDAIDTLYTDYEDTDGLREDVAVARDLGFDGKMAIHPAQVPVINEAFTPNEETIEWAQNVLDARDRAESGGRGVFSVEGEMIDAPLIAQAEDVLRRARAADQSPE
jgi:citrate lyase subunit beta/citryl-CoA lyase